jgi:hypothetical protein
MKKILKSLFVIIFMAAAFIICAPQAKAAAPAGLTVLTGFKAWGQSGVQPVDMGGAATVVQKRTSNGVNIPIQGTVNGCTYNGNMLDSDNNGSTDTNSALWGTGGDFLGYSYTVRENLIWCGNCAGVPNGEFEFDVEVAFRNGGFIDDNKLRFGGTDRRGRWEGYWYRQLSSTTNSDSIDFQGRKVRVQAYNPYTTVVVYTFVEDPPTGVAVVTKYAPANHADNGVVSDVPAEINNATVKFYYQDPNDATNWVPIGTGGTSNPFVEDSLFTFIKLTVNVEVPPGYKLTKASVSNAAVGNNANVNITDCFTTAAGRKFCRIGLPYFGVKLAFSFYDFTNIKVWYDTVSPPAQLSCAVGSTFSNNSITINNTAVPVGTIDPNEYYYYGYGIDPTSQTTQPRIELFEGGVSRGVVSGTTVLPSALVTSFKNNGFPNITATQKYALFVPVPSSLRDGETHVIQPRLLKSDGTTYTVAPNITVGPGGSCDPPPNYYPWLQTKQGNVISNGQINGQKIGDFLSARTPSYASGKEAEFAIMSWVGGGGPFCSNYSYILSNTAALTDTGCGNGTGYKFSRPSLGNDTNDIVYNSVNNRYNALSASCKTTNSGKPPSTLPSIATCPDGYIHKFTGTSFGDYVLNNGRITILVDGNLTINNNITYATGTITDSGTTITDLNLEKLKAIPNLAIVVRGNVTIQGNATDINAAIYATGYINTCNNALPQVCRYQLRVNGLLSAKNGFIFARLNQANIASNGHEPAELVTLTPQSILYPPPGLEYTSIFSGESTTKLDTSEYQPRF